MESDTAFPRRKLRKIQSRSTESVSPPCDQRTAIKSRCKKLKGEESQGTLRDREGVPAEAGQSRNPFPSHSTPLCQSCHSEHQPGTALPSTSLSAPLPSSEEEGKRGVGRGSDQRPSHQLPGFHFWTQREVLGCGEEKKNMPLCE